jgi:hypothetical protein
MTVNSQIATVAAAIAGLTISGVTMRDIDEIPDSAALLCPLMLPQPDNFVTNLAYSRETFGSMGAAKMNTSYTLNYAYLHCEVGSGLNTYASYAGIISKLELILETIMSNDVINGAVDIQVESIGNIGVIPDPAGVQYWGLLFSFRVLEFTQ